MKLFNYLLVIVLLAVSTGCAKKEIGKISSKTKFTFLTEEYQPINYSNKGKVAGMAVDVIKALCKELNITPDIKVELWKTAYNTALKTPNAILFSAAKIEVREDQFYWLEPSLMKYKEYFYRKHSRNIELKNLDDAKKYRIGTTTDFSSEQYLKSKGFTNLISYPTQEDTIKALMEEKIDLVVFGTFRVEVLIKKMGYSSSHILPALKIRDANLYITISKETSPEIVKEWQKAFDIIRENKTYYKIYEKWFFSMDF